MSIQDDAAANASLDDDFGDSKGAKAPATWYIAIFDSLGNELTGTGGINRIAVANTGAAAGTNWPDASARAKSNGVDVTSSSSTGAWSAAGHTVKLADTASGAATFWDGGNLSADISIPAAGYSIRFLAGNFTVTA